VIRSADGFGTRLPTADDVEEEKGVAPPELPVLLCVSCQKKKEPGPEWGNEDRHVEFVQVLVSF